MRKKLHYYYSSYAPGDVFAVMNGGTRAFRLFVNCKPLRGDISDNWTFNDMNQTDNQNHPFANRISAKQARKLAGNKLLKKLRKRVLSHYA